MAPRHGPRLTAAVEAAIHADGGHQEQKTPSQYIDPIALGALIVAIAQFGYQVYTDRKDRGQQPPREAIAQAIRIERRKHSELTGEETEVIDIVSAKVIEHGDDQLPGCPVNQRAARPLELEAAAHPGFQLSLDAQIIQLCVGGLSNRTHVDCAHSGGYRASVLCPPSQPVTGGSRHRAVRDAATAQGAVTADQDSVRTAKVTVLIKHAEPCSRSAAAASANNEVANTLQTVAS